MKKCLIIVPLSCAVLIGLFIVLDYFNISKMLGLDVSSLNWDFILVLVSNCILVGLYLVTYFLIDRKNLLKSENQKKIANVTLKQIYNSCKEMVLLFDDDKMLRHAVDKCDFGKLVYEDSAHMRYRDYPFDHNSIIFEFARSGVISGEEFQRYLQIQKNYKKYITMLITFFDTRSVTNGDRRILMQDIDTAIGTL